MGHFAKVVHRIAGVGTVIGAGFLIGAMLLMVANIVYRFFGGVIAGTYELVGLFMVVTAAFALGYTALRQGHVVVKIVVSRFSKRTQAIIESFTSAIGLGLLALIVWESVWLTREKVLVGGEESAMLGVPFLPFRCAWMLGLFLFCLVLLIDLLKALSRVKSK
jgi:TRAP-type C4-dicarboxylate transport system permease small subunit